MNIIGGSAKGTVLLSPKGRGTRPTLSRVRESVFNILTNVGLVDTRVLDIFAGTGAMGLEALSRGAAEAVFIDKATGRIISRNAEKCHMAERAVVLSRDVKAALSSLSGKKFDYIFMDPPYRKDYINEVLSLVFGAGLPAADAILVVEHSVSEPPDISLFADHCSLWKEKKLGAIVVTYLRCR